MKIHDDHLYHGSALIQIAEHLQFTAINSLKIGSRILRSAYRINNQIGVYLKYAVKPTPSFKEYIFTFHKDHLKELKQISKQVQKTYIALVCVKDREICCISYLELKTMINERIQVKGGEEEQYAILVTVPVGKSMRVYMNYPQRRKAILGDKKIVSRTSFPDILFK